MLVVATLMGCGSSGHPVQDAGNSGTEACTALLQSNTTEAPTRDRLSACGERMLAQTRLEGATPRGTELGHLAGALYERSYRIEWRKDDGDNAVEAYRLAAARLEGPEGCDGALRGAFLTGELARDAQATYLELYRIDRRLAEAASGRAPTLPLAEAGAPSAVCRDRVTAALSQLAAFRPGPSTLEAVDRALIGEGIVQLKLDGGASPVAPPSHRILRIQRWVGREDARVVIVLDRPAAFRVGDDASVAGAPRTYVDLEGVDGSGMQEELVTAGIVTRIRTESTIRGTRVALELDGKAFRKVFALPEPYRLVMDIARTPPSRSNRALRKVVLDPGHGGIDPGALGPGGIREKDVTLAIAQKVAAALVRAGVDVVLTRDDDRLVTLEERTARANASGADLFLSIHCNASEGHGRKGVETYVLDTSSNDMAGRLAARENATSAQANAELSSILASMRIADQSTRSKRFAELLQRAVLSSIRPSYPGAVDGGVHTAGFYVLVGARMPAVLFESSYISNTEEGPLLVTDAYQNRLADGILNAVRAYGEGR
ncbi:MAG: N-acetylmuramoyl-L-alanine amidase [Polyangiaceae bacterium]